MGPCYWMRLINILPHRFKCLQTPQISWTCMWKCFISHVIVSVGILRSRWTGIGDTVPFVRSPGPPCVMVPTGSPCKFSGDPGPLHCLQPAPSAVPQSPLAWVVHTDFSKTFVWLLLFCALLPESFEFPVCTHGGCIHILWSWLLNLTTVTMSTVAFSTSGKPECN